MSEAAPWRMLSRIGLHSSPEAFSTATEDVLKYMKRKLTLALIKSSSNAELTEEDLKILTLFLKRVEWRLTALDLLEFAPQGLKSLEHHVKILKPLLRIPSSSSAIELFPEFKELKQQLSDYEHWKTDLFHKLPQQLLTSRTKRARKSLTPFSSASSSLASASSSPATLFTATESKLTKNVFDLNHPKAIEDVAVSMAVKPSLDWLQEKCAVAASKFLNFTTREIEACSDSYKTGKLKEATVKKAVEDILRAHEIRRGSIASKKQGKQLLGLTGLEVLNYRRLYEETTFLNVLLPSAPLLQQKIEYYDFVVLLKDVFFGRKGLFRSVTDNKILALCDSMPCVLAERFLEDVEMLQVDPFSLSEEQRDIGDDDFLLKTLRWVVKQRNLESSLFDRELIEESVKPKREQEKQRIRRKEKEGGGGEEGRSGFGDPSKEAEGRKDVGSGETVEGIVGVKREREGERGEGMRSGMSVEGNMKIAENRAGVKPKTAGVVETLKAEKRQESSTSFPPSKRKPTRGLSMSLRDTALFQVSPACRKKDFREAKLNLLKQKLPIRYSHGWVTTLGEMTTKQGHSGKRWLLPIGYTVHFKFASLNEPSLTMMYSLEVLKGPEFRLTYMQRGELVSGIYTALINVRNRFRRRFKSYRSKGIEICTGPVIDIKKLLGLRSEKVCRALEGLPYVLSCSEYHFINSRSIADRVELFDTCVSSQQMLSVELQSEDLKLSLETNGSSFKQKQKERNGIDLRKSQGKRMRLSYFKITDFQLVGQAIKKAFHMLSQHLECFEAKMGTDKAEKTERKAAELQFCMLMPGLLAFGNTLEKSNTSLLQSASSSLATRQTEDSLPRRYDDPEHHSTELLEVLQRCKDLTSLDFADSLEHPVALNSLRGYETKVVETFDPLYSLSLDVFKTVPVYKQQKSTTRGPYGSVEMISTKIGDIHKLPPKQEHFRNIYVLYSELEELRAGEEKENVAGSNGLTQLQRSVVRLADLDSTTLGASQQNLRKEIVKLYSSRLSQLPIHIFETTECVCGHEFHSPRLTLTLKLAQEVVTSCTVCFSTIGFISGSKDLCVIEIEGIATKSGFEGRCLASLLLVFLRLIALEIEAMLQVEVAMVAKTSSSSEFWWSSRSCFLSSLRKIKKLNNKETNEADFIRWKTWVDESGKKNHQFFNHREVQGRSVFWLSRNDELKSADQQTKQKVIREVIQKVFQNA